MIRHFHIPKPPLSEFVELFWLFDDYNLPHAKERLLPTGTVELVINLKENSNRVYPRNNPDKYESYSGALVCGAHSEFCVIDTAASQSVMGVHFKPGGAWPFLKLAAGELQNRHASLDDIWAGPARDLRDQLLETPAPTAKFEILEAALMREALDIARHPAVPFALHKFRNALHTETVANVVGQMALSQKQFIQIFRREVGLTPKTYCRVQRFQRVLTRLFRQKQVKWVEVALDCGYYDQAHFNHDFRAFSGLNPTTYHMHQTEHLNHVPIHD